jgi:hypothetical protein
VCCSCCTIAAKELYCVEAVVYKTYNDVWLGLVWTIDYSFAIFMKGDEYGESCVLQIDAEIYSNNNNNNNNNGNWSITY